MAFFYDEPSYTFSEYLLIPRYSSKEHIPEAISLETPLTKFKKGEAPALSLNIPLVSSIMQSVSGSDLAIALAKEGGVSFIFCSQSIESEVKMIAKVKNHKAGFVESDSNIQPHKTLADIIDLKAKTAHTTVAVTEDGSAHGKLVGVVTSRDYRIDRMNPATPVSSFMTPLADLKYAAEGTSLKEANNIIWDFKLNSLPIVDKQGNLNSFVFRKDYESKKSNPNELLDSKKRYIVGAGINTRDYKERIPALVEAGADILCIDSSDGFSEWQKETIQFVKQTYGNALPIGAGNVVDAEGFRFLADAGADFIKVGVGGGSICITRETKGIGRGQATSIIEISKERNKYFEETGIYIPICSDGGIAFDYHMALALAMGADFCMLGRYFARFDESPTNKVLVNGNYMKEYWGEGSARARNWQRYDSGGSAGLMFEEGVDSYVPYAGSLHNNVQGTVYKIKATMSNCGVVSIADFQKNSKITRVSSAGIIEGGPHDVLLKDGQISYR